MKHTEAAEKMSRRFATEFKTVKIPHTGIDASMGGLMHEPGVGTRLDWSGSIC